MAARKIRPRVEVEGDSIIVSFPGTRCMVTYRKADDKPELIVTNMRRDSDPSIRQRDFLARAWRIANDKARELGWIV